MPVSSGPGPRVASPAKDSPATLWQEAQPRSWKGRRPPSTSPGGGVSCQPARPPPSRGGAAMGMRTEPGGGRGRAEQRGGGLPPPPGAGGGGGAAGGWLRAPAEGEESEGKGQGGGEQEAAGHVRQLATRPPVKRALLKRPGFRGPPTAFERRGVRDAPIHPHTRLNSAAV